MERHLNIVPVMSTHVAQNGPIGVVGVSVVKPVAGMAFKKEVVIVLPSMQRRLLIF